MTTEDTGARTRRAAFMLVAVVVVAAIVVRVGAPGVDVAPRSGESLPTRSPAAFQASATPGDTLAAYPAPGDTGLRAPGDGTRATRAARTLEPRPTPSPPAYAAALPPGAVFDPDRVDRWPYGSLPRRDLVGVAYRIDGRSSYAVVSNEGGAPLWDVVTLMGDRAAGVTQVEDVPLFEHRIDEPGTDSVWRPAVRVVAAGTTEYVVLDVLTDTVRVAARLPITDLTAYRLAEGGDLFRGDVTGDGRAELLLTVADTLLMFEPPADPARPAVERARFPDSVQLVDVDEDGAYEVLTPAGEGRWDVRRWDEAGYVAADPIIEPPAPAPDPVSREALPPLPADLFFEQGDEIFRWPKAGGRLETVWPRPGTYTGEEGWHLYPKTRTWDPGLRSRWQVSADGKHLAVVESLRQDGGPYAPAAPARFRIVDLEAGGEALVEASGRVQDHWWQGGWALSADGRSLAYLAWDPPTTGPFDWDTENQRADVVALDVARPDQPRRLGTCDFYTPPAPRDQEHGTRDCLGLRLAPDGRRVAYADGRGLWVVEWPEDPNAAPAAPRLVREHHYGDSEASIRLVSPWSWSPAGTHLLVRQAYYEGSDLGVLSLADGALRLLPGSQGYGGDITAVWLPDGGGVLSARRGDALGRGGLTRIDNASEAVPAPLLPEVRVVTGWNALTPQSMPDGTVRLGLRDVRPGLYRTNGVFAVGANGRGLRRLASLPPYDTDAEDSDTRLYSGDMLWSPDGSTFLVLDLVSWDPISRRAWLGTGDGGTLWDATPVIGTADNFQWGGTHYPLP